MARDRGSYKEQRRDRDGEAARESPEDEDMFFGASPSEKAALRQTKEPKKMKLAELNLNAVDRDKLGAPEKVGENMRLIDIAMSDTDPPPAPRPRPAAPASTGRPARPAAPAPEPDPPARRTPTDYVPTGEQGQVQGKLHVLLPWRNRLERAAWVLAVLIAAAGLALPLALPALHPELAVAAAAERESDLDPWGHAWDARDVGEFSLGPDGVQSADDLQRPAPAPGGLAHWASWGRELALLLAGGLVWLASTLSLTLDLRSPSRVVEAVRAALLASLPALLGAGAILWGADQGQAWGVPDPPESLR
ncbi:MAG: hypothetical protein KDD82_25610, partial [Planctomycetes bacterium]|nr:hypothetical protein [Planctomycetota bacterium]